MAGFNLLQCRNVLNFFTQFNQNKLSASLSPWHCNHLPPDPGLHF